MNEPEGGSDDNAGLIGGVIESKVSDGTVDQASLGQPISSNSIEQLQTTVKSVTPTIMDDNVQETDAISRTHEPSKSQSNTPSQSAVSGGSLFSRLKQPSTESNDDKSNITSSIASALSSFSLFTSNFNLSNSQSVDNRAANEADTHVHHETAHSSSTVKPNYTIETRESILSRKAQLERSNLIKLTKLIVKDLISSSLKFSRTINDCQGGIHLHNYFTLVDRVLKHGLKEILLSTRSAGLWNALEGLPKFLKESTLISESIRSLNNTKTFDGKIKAWVRLSLMQKKLPEYFNTLLENRDVLLKNIYHPSAFMLNDEAHVFAGLIIGVNVIDCNFFVKDDNFDAMDDIIDLSPYLKNAYGHDDDEEDSFSEQPNPDVQNLTAILDQKNYLEERNRRLESTITNLNAEVRNLEEKNSRLEMELKVSEAQIVKLQENTSEQQGSVLGKHPNQLLSSTLTGAFKNFLGSSEQPKSKLLVDGTTSEEQGAAEVACSDPTMEEVASLNMNTNQNIHDVIDKPPTDSCNEDDKLNQSKRRIDELEKELSTLKVRVQILETSYRGALEKIKVLERDLDLQVSISGDKDNTIRIYEKDIRDKEAQVSSLRTSLSEFKKIQAELHERLADTDGKMKDRVKSVMNLQTNLDKWKIENKNLATSLQLKQAALLAANSELEKLKKEKEELKNYNTAIDEELKRERENGRSSSTTVEAQNLKITSLNDKIKQLDSELGGLSSLKLKFEETTRKCREYEQSLEEVGSQLRESRLEVEMLKENSSVFLDSQWINSKSVRLCTLCQETFSVTRRKHHCRLCGEVFCNTCSDNKMELASSSKPVRVCDTCHAFLLAKFVKSSTA